MKRIEAINHYALLKEIVFSEKFGDKLERCSATVISKVMRIRLAYKKISEEFEESRTNFIKELKPEGFDDKATAVNEKDTRLKELIALKEKNELSAEQSTELQELQEAKDHVSDIELNVLNPALNKFTQKTLDENVLIGVEDKLTIDEYMELVGMNSGKTAMLNGRVFSNVNLIEELYSVLVSE